MHCPQCGVQVGDTAKFCHQCGAKLGGATAADGDGGATPGNRFQAAAARATREVPEVEVWKGSYSPKAMVGLWLLAIVVSVIGVIVGALRTGYLGYILGGIALYWLWLGGLLVWRRWDVSYRLTNQRFFHKKGVLSRVIERIEVIDMDDVTCLQGPIERLMGIGTIKITSSDRTHPEIWLHGIENVQAVSQQFDDARRAERMRRGLHVEAL